MHSLKQRQTDAGDMYLVILVHQHTVAAAEKKFHFINLCWFQVIIFKPGQPKNLAWAVLSQFEWTGAVGFQNPTLSRCYVFSVEHKANRVGEFRKEISLWGVSCNGQRLVINDLDTGDVVGQPRQPVAHAHDVIEEDAGVEGLGDWVSRPFQRPFNVVGSNRLAVMKGGTGSQSEGRSGSVRAHIPRFGQVTNDCQLLVDSHQSAENLHRVNSRFSIRVQMRIQGGWVRSET